MAVGGGAMMCEARKVVFPVFASFLILTAFASVSAAKTIYVPDDYEKIQWAVDNASAGDTIIVRDGIYSESVNVNKQLSIKSENGSENCIIYYRGIELNADGILIEGFTIESLGYFGIEIYSNNNTIASNYISNNEHGIFLFNSNNNTIISNHISNNSRSGICLDGSNNNIIASNYISNYWYGVLCNDSNENTIKNNEFINDGLFVLYSYGNIVENNTVNGKPLVYLEDESDRIIDNADNAGQVILVKCKNITVMNAELTNTTVGIESWICDNCSILNNNISNNDYGILFLGNNTCISNNNINSNYWCGIALGGSNNSISNNNINSNYWCGISLCGNNNSISKNNISSNYWYGIYLEDSNNNIIYLNNFINNTYNAYSYNSTNVWNSTEPIKYTYRGSEFTNYIGNYWDDYTGYDANGDGIGETPYSIDENNTDNYPLIERFENYFVPTPTPAQIFDTGRPENPYPSISGEFVGTIRTNTTIIATKLYTYACEGTGGHTEHALICNKTWCAYAEWDGYKEDWMNISFNRTVVLMPYETYNITIVTGSYPQIHHTPSLKTENGWINCTEFTDANGKKYEDWIPAIMLWS